MNNTRDDHPEIDLILGYEELEGSEKARADRILAENPDLARRLDVIREREKSAVDPVPLGDEDAFWEPAPGVSIDARRRQRSLNQVRLAAGLGRRSPGRWLLPMAAILALAILLPRWVGQPAGITDLQVLRVSSLQDETRNGGDLAFRSGDAVALNFHLDRPAHVVICLVDAEGGISFIIPEAEGPFEAGDHTYPDPAGTTRWILNDAVGEEVFLLGIQAGELPDTRRLREALAGLEGQGDRESRLREARSLLSRNLEEVREIRIDHQN